MVDTTPQLEELRAIRRMIADTRRSTVRHWAYLMIWGVLGVVASGVSHALLLASREPWIALVWAVYVAVGLALSMMFSAREERRTRTATFAGRVLSVTWTAIGTTIGALYVAVLILEMPPPFFPGVIALLLAIGLSVMGAVLEYRVFYAAAVSWWLGGLLMMARPRDAYVIEACLLVFGYLVPAALLRRELARDDAASTDD